MNIHFYLDNEEKTEITLMYNLTSNPFKIGDIISLNVEELYPSDYTKFKEGIRNNMISNNKELETKFKRKNVKIVREAKYIDFNVAKESKLTIEYHCIYSND